jgi:late competence protein required for DNA uptake (superfamily II DNA/RNA helicase)
MTNQRTFIFDEPEDEVMVQKPKRWRCPRCRKQPKNIADKNIGFAFSCLCRCSMLGRFSFYEEIATDDWNRLVLKMQKSMEHIIPRKRKKQTEI